MNLSKRVLGLFLCGLCLGCSDGKPKTAAGGDRGGRKIPVEVVDVESRAVAYEIASVGSLEASDVVSVTARVAGVAEKVAFREGDAVASDQVLVEIEPERFKLEAARADADLRRAEAMRHEAEAALAKRTELQAKNRGWVSDEELLTYRSRLDVARAEESQAKAARDLAELNVRNAYVQAASRGEIQRRAVQPGQYVSAGAVLATLVKLDPLYLRFQVAEREALQLGKGQAATFRIRADPDARFEARLVHVADSADPKSRRVECLAEVVSKDPRLHPGFFAEVAIRTSSSSTVPVVPEGAIRPTEKGFVVYVVQDEKAVEKLVETGLRTPDGGVEIRSGLSPGERLVVRGAQFLRPGVAVEIKPGEAAVGAGKAAS